MEEHVETTAVEHEIPITGSDEVMRIPVFSQLAVLAVIMLLIFGTGYIPKILARLTPPPATPAETVTPNNQYTTATNTLEVVNPFSAIALAAESVFVWDPTTDRVLYELNPDEQLPLASVTKLMTALVTHELVATTDPIAITTEAINQDGASGLLPGESFSLQNLSDLVLLSSSNDGAYALAQTVGALLAPDGDASTFVAAMNIRAEELGLTQTYFRNPTGLDITEDEAGAYGSARDIAFLLEYILINQPGILEETAKTNTVLVNTAGATHAVQNTNQYVDDIAGIIGSKTGYTELAGGNLAVAFDAGVNRPVIIVALGSTRYGRFQDILQLTDAARTAIQ